MLNTRAVLLVAYFSTLANCLNYDVVIHGDTPIVSGATAHFTALLTDDGDNATGTYKFKWVDNGIEKHSQTNIVDGCVDTWNVSYANRTLYPPGIYEIQLSIEKSYIIYVTVTSARYVFEITAQLNGELRLFQRNVSREIYVSTTDVVKHEVQLHAADAEFLNTYATSVVTYWLIDCVYYGPANNLTFDFNYTTPLQNHTVEALVVANFDPLPTPAPLTTTVPPTTVAPNVTTTTRKTTINTTTEKSSTEKIAVDQNRVKRNATLITKNTTSLIKRNISLPYVCNNRDTPPKPGNTYGYFKTKLVAKAPIANVTIDNLKWIHHGELLNLTVKCHGSSMFDYCLTYYKGVYNSTGNETCQIIFKTEVCEIPIRRYFASTGEYTVLIIISNELNKVVHPVTITVYDVKKQAQLSVIVVPVAFILLAVVLVVFGVAYFIQSRSRFIVEVADFNFGQQYSDMEYKTFMERLRDSVSNMFTRVPSPTPSTSEVPVWPPSRKYGSMVS